MILTEHFIQQCQALVGVNNVIADRAGLRVYECDALSAYRHLPALVVLPETVEQVQGVLKLCSAHEVPVVARGAGTGLAGGALPVEDAAILLCELDGVNQRAKLTRVLGKTALKSCHSRLFK